MEGVSNLDEPVCSGASSCYVDVAGIVRGEGRDGGGLTCRLVDGYLIRLVSRDCKAEKGIL